MVNRYFIIEQMFRAYVIEMSSKMTSTLSRKMVNHFCQNASNFVYLVPYDFVQISPACILNTYQIMYGETSDVSVSNGNIKCLIGN